MNLFLYCLITLFVWYPFSQIFFLSSWIFFSSDSFHTFHSYIPIWFDPSIFFMSFPFNWFPIIVDFVSLRLIFHLSYLVKFLFANHTELFIFARYYCNIELRLSDIIVLLYIDPWIYITKDISNPRTKTNFCIRFLLVSSSTRIQQSLPFWSNWYR